MEAPKAIRRLAFVILGGFASLIAPPALAHPHVWIVVQSTVLYENGSVVGIRHKWTFDEMYTAMAIQGLDTNNDGIYDRKELSELANVNVAGLKEVGYFTQVTLAGQALEFADVRDYYLEYTEAKNEPASDGAIARMQGPADGKAAQKPMALSLYFTLPLKQPVLAETPGFAFTVNDPTFFIAFEFAKDGVKVGPGAPAGCRAVIGAEEGAKTSQKNLGDAFAAQGLGVTTDKPVTVSCQARP
jgi:ABC-type uncharacterized transport system substrate-binding protein